jgi:hypothetical protein
MTPPALDELGKLPVPVGPKDEVLFPRLYGPREELLAPPTELEELGKLPVPVGPTEDVEFEDVAYGADEEADDTKPLARLEEEG